MSRKKIALSIAGVLGVVLVVLAVLWFVPVLRVSTIEVSGNEHHSTEEIISAADIPEGSNVLRVDDTAAAWAVTELTWVKSATVNRSLPSTIEIAVEEKKAALYADESDGTVLIDAEGRAITFGEPPAGAVRSEVGLDGDRAVLAGIVKAVGALDDKVREQVESVSSPSEGEITLHFHDGRTVYWGSPEDSERKARATATVLGHDGQHWNVSNPELVSVR